MGHPYRKILCTAAVGAIDVSRHDRLLLTVPLAQTPVPGLDPLVEALDRAGETAIRRAGDFSVVSAALARTRQPRRGISSSTAEPSY